MEIICIPQLTLNSKNPIGKGSHNICVFVIIFPIRKRLPTQEMEVGSTPL